MGNAQLLTPADDSGALAGREINDFGIDLLRRLDSTGNLCASPTSIALALAMVRLGARGDTAAEMDAVLHSVGSNASAGEIVALLASLEQRPIYEQSGEISDTPFYAGQEPLVELDVSNQVFSQPGMTLEQAYLDALSSTFGAGVGLLDFAKDPEAARLVINRWASDKTHGRIPSVLQPGDVNEFTRIALAGSTPSTRRRPNRWRSLAVTVPRYRFPRWRWISCSTTPPARAIARRSCPTKTHRCRC
jgi:serpin B